MAHAHRDVTTRDVGSGRGDLTYEVGGVGYLRADGQPVELKRVCASGGEFCCGGGGANLARVFPANFGRRAAYANKKNDAVAPAHGSHWYQPAIGRSGAQARLAAPRACVACRLRRLSALPLRARVRACLSLPAARPTPRVCARCSLAAP